MSCFAREAWSRLLNFRSSVGYEMNLVLKKKTFQKFVELAYCCAKLPVFFRRHISFSSLLHTNKFWHKRTF